MGDNVFGSFGIICFTAFTYISLFIDDPERVCLIFPLPYTACVTNCEILAACTLVPVNEVYKCKCVAATWYRVARCWVLWHKS
ncbi:hypothetical protein V1517DRAFT_333800 [Lipomyces orientalis]|uniref:Uncharacterized protein n=1 Tax=Lipomyces orientalis TaxID=1233043 RepID=A0ACC3TE37_9ASCO